MDKRAARKLVAHRAASLLLALDDAEFAAYPPADRRRLWAARDDLATELEVRAGVIDRQPRGVAHDPGQYVLITLDQDGMPE